LEKTKEVKTSLKFKFKVKEFWPGKLGGKERGPKEKKMGPVKPLEFAKEKGIAQ